MIAIGNAVGDVTSVWGVHPFNAPHAHRWTYRESTGAGSLIASACGLLLLVTPAVPLLKPGDFARCRRCSRVTKKGAAHET